MPCFKVTREIVNAIKALRLCTPQPSYCAIGRLLGMDHSTISRAAQCNPEYKLGIHGSDDAKSIAEQLRILADQIEHGVKILK